MATTIQISDKVKVFLDSLRLMERESYNDVLEFIMEDSMEMNKKTKMEVDKARARVADGDIISHDDAMGQLGL